MPRIDPDREKTMQVDLQLMNGNRVQAIVRIDDVNKVFTRHTYDPDMPCPHE